MSLESGTKVGRYTISRLIAQGGMAEVYRAEQDLTGGISRPVAVKVIRPEYSESQDFREMFLDEARVACTLSHPNIVHIYEVGETDEGQLYMAMELVSGETLATVNRTMRGNDERFSDEALFSIGIMTCSALDAVHALKVEGGVANLVHRDVSPHNLLLSTTGSLKLIDFGIAKAATNRNLTLPGVTKGKAGYFSPEQAMGKKLDGRSDLFSLGVTLYKLAAGGTPFDDYKNHAERHAALVRGQWKNLDEVYPGLPEGFYEVINRSLGVKQEDRYQTAREMREALERAAFDAHIRIGQSSLMGFLDDDGEITADGGSRMSAFPGITSPPSQHTLKPLGMAVVAPPSAASARLIEAHRPSRGHQTERLEPVEKKEGGSSKRGLFIAAFIAAMVLGVGGTVVALGSGETPKQPTVVKKTTEVVTPPPKPVVIAVKVDPPPSNPVIDAGEETVIIDSPPVAKVKTPPKQKNPVLVATKQPDKPVERVQDKPDPTKDEVIPEGNGKLQIEPGNYSGRVEFSIDGAAWDDAPKQERVSSGVHKVRIKYGDGTTGAFTAKVWPTKTTVMLLDANSLKWSSQTR